MFFPSNTTLDMDCVQYTFTTIANDMAHGTEQHHIRRWEGFPFFFSAYYFFAVQHGMEHMAAYIDLT